jgi:hypothetical protein
MTLRWKNRLFYLSGALLYAGPLLAGLAGQGVAAGLVLTAVFTLWQVLLHPERWPKTAADWARPAPLAAAALTVAVQALVVALVLGLGRGLAALGLGLPGLPLVMPIILALVGAALARLAWNPQERVEMEAFLDEAIAQIEGMAAAAPDAAPSGPAPQQSQSDWLLAGFANDLHEAGAGSAECDNLVRQLVKLDEPEHEVLGVLLEWRSFHVLCEAALLRYVGHPFTLGLRLDPEQVVDWVEAALRVPETQTDAAAMAHGWLGKAESCGGFGLATPRLLALLQTVLETAPDADLALSLQNLRTALEPAS